MNPEYLNAMHRPADVASAKPAACTGLIGKRCSCGLWHAPGGMRVERGIQSDHAEMPITFAGDEPINPVNVIARCFRFAMAVAAVVCGWLAGRAWGWW